MKAVRFHEHGGAEVLRYEDAPEPDLGAGEVLVRVRACALNHLDHVVIEHVGEATWPKSVRSLARGGRLVTCGATTGPKGTLDLNALFGKQLSLLGTYMGTKGELMRVARFFFAGQLKPVIDRTFPLAEAAAAQRHLEESRQFGKIVLEV